MRAWWLALQRRARTASDHFWDLLNITLYYRGGWLDVRVLDIVLFAGGVACMGWYYYTSGWLGALQGGVFYLFITLCVLWFFPSDKEMK